MVTQKQQDWTYECPDCGQTFIRPEAFQKHTKKIHHKETTACRNCPCYFNQLNELFLHARQIHNIKTRQTKTNCKLQCTFNGCTYQTNNGGLMKHHYRSHVNMRPFMCAICKKTFTQKSNMKTHFNRHKKNNFKFDCISCEKSFNSYDILLSHLETREHYIGEYLATIEINFQCMVCRSNFDNPTDTYMHGESCIVSNVINQFDCGNCHAGLRCDLTELTDHYKVHKSEIVCPFCNDRVFTNKTTFNFHLTKEHQKKVDRRKSCRYCEEVFDNEQLRNEHVEMEHKDLKNKHRSCETNGRILCHFDGCDFKTNSVMYLQKHLNVHYKNLDLDSFYMTDNNGQPIENGDTQIKVESTMGLELSRKRGRPRLCDSSENHDSSSLSPHGFAEPPMKRKQRGRPRKDCNNSISGDTNDALAFAMSPLEYQRKRGRPRKIKMEESIANEGDHYPLMLEGIEDIDYCIDNVYDYLRMGDVDGNVDDDSHQNHLQSSMMFDQHQNDLQQQFYQHYHSSLHGDGGFSQQQTLFSMIKGEEIIETFDA